MSMRAKVQVLGVAAFVAVASSAAAQTTDARATPKSWNYEIHNGQRVPKGSRVTNPDGSWREEQRQGNCVTVKEMSKAGEYKETRQCNPTSPH